MYQVQGLTKKEPRCEKENFTMENLVVVFRFQELYLKAQ